MRVRMLVCRSSPPWQQCWCQSPRLFLGLIKNSIKPAFASAARTHRARYCGIWLWVAALRRAFSPRLATACADTALDGARSMLGGIIVVGKRISRASARLEECMWGRTCATPWVSAHVAMVVSRCRIAIAPDRIRADMAFATLLRTFVASAGSLRMEIDAAARHADRGETHHWS